MKQCQGCGETKPFDHFHRMQRSPDGYRPRCKACRKPETTENYVANREEIKAKSKAWREANPERYRALLKDWGKRNKAHKREKDREYYKTHKPQRVEYNGLPERQVADRLHAKNQKAKRRAQIGATLHRITKDEWQGLKKQYVGRCAYCGAETDNPTMDHVVPLIHGGHHTVENIVPACGPCNRGKGTRAVMEFMASRTTGSPSTTE